MPEREVVDFRDVPDIQDFSEPMPPGVYRCRVIAPKAEVSKASGQPMYTLELMVTDGQYYGRRLWHRKVITQKTAPFVKADLKALGIPVPQHPVHADVLARQVASRAVDKEVLARVTVEEFDGVPRNRVVSLQPAPAVPKQEPQEEYGPPPWEYGEGEP